MLQMLYLGTVRNVEKDRIASEITKIMKWLWLQGEYATLREMIATEQRGEQADEITDHKEFILFSPETNFQFLFVLFMLLLCNRIIKLIVKEDRKNEYIFR